MYLPRPVRHAIVTLPEEPAVGGLPARVAAGDVRYSRQAILLQLLMCRRKRTQREEYDRRRAAWDGVLAAWEASGEPADQQYRLVEWLQAATDRSSPGSIESLPEIPAFAPSPDQPPPMISKFSTPRQPGNKTVHADSATSVGNGSTVRILQAVFKSISSGDSTQGTGSGLPRIQHRSIAPQAGAMPTLSPTPHEPNKSDALKQLDAMIERQGQPPR